MARILSVAFLSRLDLQQALVMDSSVPESLPPLPEPLPPLLE